MNMIDTNILDRNMLDIINEREFCKGYFFFININMLDRNMLHNYEHVRY